MLSHTVEQGGHTVGNLGPIRGGDDGTAGPKSPDPRSKPDPAGREGDSPVTAYVTTAAGRTFQLPVPLSWELNYTAGVPSDSFWVRCPWQAGQGRTRRSGSDSPQRRRARRCFPGWWTSAR